MTGGVSVLAYGDRPSVTLEHGNGPLPRRSQARRQRRGDPFAENRLAVSPLYDQCSILNRPLLYPAVTWWELARHRTPRWRPDSVGLRRTPRPPDSQGPWGGHGPRLRRDHMIAPHAAIIHAIATAPNCLLPLPTPAQRQQRGGPPRREPSGPGCWATQGTSGDSAASLQLGERIQRVQRHVRRARILRSPGRGDMLVSSSAT